MNVHFLPEAIERAPVEIDPDIRNLLVGMRRAMRWRIWPYGWWQEDDGSYVIFDRLYRPICRKRPCGTVEIVRPDQWIAYVDQRYLYTDIRHPDGNTAIAQRLFGIVQRLGIRDELARRRGLDRRRRLPRWDRIKGVA